MMLVINSMNFLSLWQNCSRCVQVWNSRNTRRHCLHHSIAMLSYNTTNCVVFQEEIFASHNVMLPWVRDCRILSWGQRKISFHLLLYRSKQILRHCVRMKHTDLPYYLCVILENCSTMNASIASSWPFLK